ncbi:MAG: ATP-dependent DNA helicase [Nanoarchaeota archaeon]
MNAIEKVNGPCVILAGAGTGKTYAIVEKMKHLVQIGVKPERIVCITFSNEAANNLVLRIEKILGINGNSNNASKPVIRTFHGFSADLLRSYGDKIGIGKEFKILDPDQAKVILHRNLKVNVINCHRYIGTIGTAKDLGIKLEEFQKFLSVELSKYEGINLEGKLETLNFEFQTMHIRKDWDRKKVLVSEMKRLKRIIELKKFVSAWNAYEKLKAKGNYQDYSDLNANALHLLEDNPEIAENYDYVVVDEFQDTNKLQLDFLFRLCLNGNITIVGDMNQSIYRFRGAYKDNYSFFKKAFEVKEDDVFNLSKSYRSPNKVLKLAHTLILNNYQNKEECFFVDNAHNREGDKIEVYEMKDAREEARKVVELIKKEIESGIALEEICVMFRAHQHGRVIRKALEEAEIAYYAVSKASLLKQKSVKTARDYMIILNKLKKKEKGGEDSWWDLVYQLDFSQEDLIKIGKAIKDFIGSNRKKEEDEKKDNIGEINGKDIVSVYLFNNLESIVSEKGKMAAKILIEKIKILIPTLDKPISELMKEVYRVAGLANEQQTKEEKEIMINLNKFYEIGKLHEELYDSTLDNFLYYLDILESLGIELDASELEEKGVRLMTSHATKGLEYKTVIITNLAQGRFPIERYISNTLIPTELLPEVKNELKGMSEDEKEEYVKSYEKYNQLLEERRLCYVSFTRVKEKLILTYAKEYGGKEFLPSMFLNEIAYKKNEDVNFEIDSEVKWSEKAEMGNKEKKFSINAFVNAQQLEEAVKNGVREEKLEEKKKLSPSALLLFDECQKKYEYRYVYNMPDRKTIGWEAMRLGSFVHLILEKGVSAGFSKVDDFLSLSREMSMEEDWESVELQEAETLIKVFFERHKGKYGEKTKTEQYLPMKMDGIDFIGFADRIDFTENGVEIIDYKTGKSNISPKDRNWQLGFYALAAQEKYGKVRKVVLDMLKQEKPLEFEIDERGNAHCISSKYIEGFNINHIREEILITAKKIQEAFKNGFKPCPVEKNCDFCNEYVYNL